LKGFFTKAGTVTSVKILMERDGRSKGLAFVGFSTEAAQAEAVKLSGTEFMGFALAIEKARALEERPQKQPY